MVPFLPTTVSTKEICGYGSLIYIYYNSQELADNNQTTFMLPMAIILHTQESTKHIMTLSPLRNSAKIEFNGSHYFHEVSQIMYESGL